jgi:spore coat polysaccharide biosynthesis protein SpsF
VNLAILQARMTSTRLPGKVLAPVLGEPMIGRQMERLRRSKRIDRLIVATSTDPSDDPLATYVEGTGTTVYRGPLADVLARYAGAAALFPEAQALVRLTADCPLADPELVDMVIERHHATGADWTTAALGTRTFPHGLDVEAIRPAALREAAERATDPYEREHVTPYLYRRPQTYRLEGVSRSPSLAHLRWTVDLPADLDFVRGVYVRLYPADPAFTSEAIVALDPNSAPIPGQSGPV